MKFDTLLYRLAFKLKPSVVFHLWFPLYDTGIHSYLLSEVFIHPMT